jgi:hypothetical protein
MYTYRVLNLLGLMIMGIDDLKATTSGVVEGTRRVLTSKFYNYTCTLNENRGTRTVNKTLPIK